MRVRDLIKELSKLDPEAKVMSLVSSSSEDIAFGKLNDIYEYDYGRRVTLIARETVNPYEIYEDYNESLKTMNAEED